MWGAYRRARLAIAGIALLLAACGGGGGGGGGGSDPSTAPGLAVSPSSLSFTAVQNGATPPTQSFQVTITRPDAAIVIAGFPVGVTPPSWLDRSSNLFSCTPSLSSCTLIVRISTTFLAPGTYTTTIRFVIGNTSQQLLALRDVQVSYTVQPQTGFGANPASLSFSQLKGGAAPAAQTLGITELGGASYAWNAAIVYLSGSGWLNVNGAGSASGATLPASLTVSINPTVALGTLNALIRLTGNGNTLDVPVSYTLAEPTIARSPASLSFNALRLGPSPATQDITLTTQGSLPLNYTTSVTYGPSASGWLSVPASGTAPGAVTAGVNTTTLAPGSYTATLGITTAAQSLSVSVTYVVSEPTLTRSPATLTFNAASGGVIPVSQDVTLSTQQNLSLGFSASISYGSATTGWLNAPTSGTAPTAISIGVNTTNLVPGTYTATVVLTTAAQTVPIGITYVVAASSLTFSPASASFVIDTTSLALALSQNVGVGSTGVTLSWTAASSQPWLTVSPPSGFSGTQVTLSLVPGQLDTLDPGTRSATVTFAYTPPNQASTSAPLSVSLDLRLPKVNYVSPYVELPNTTTEVILRGSGLSNTTGDILFGAIGVSTYTKVSDTEIRIFHPSLPAGSYPVKIPNQLGLNRTRANLVVAAVPAFTYTALPTSLIRDRTIYDAERASVYTNNWASGSTPGVQRIERHRWNGSAWVTDSKLLNGPPFDIAITPDGKELIALSGSSLYHIDLGAWSITKQLDISSLPFPLNISSFSRVGMSNDGNALLDVGTSFISSFRYNVLTGDLVQIPSPPGGLFLSIPLVSSMDGSRILVGQNGITGPLKLFYFDTSLSLFVQAFPDRPASRMSYDRTGSNSIIDGTVFDRQFQALGSNPFQLNASMISPDGTRGYGVDAGENPAVLHTFDLTSQNGTGGFIELAPIPLADLPGQQIELGITPDGKTVFISGDAKFIVQPVP